MPWFNKYNQLEDPNANRGQPRMSVDVNQRLDTVAAARQAEADHQKRLTLEGREQLNRQRAYAFQQDQDFNAQVAKENAAKAAKSNLVVGDLLGLGSGGRSRRRRAHRARRSRKAMRAGIRRTMSASSIYEGPEKDPEGRAGIRRAMSARMSNQVPVKYLEGPEGGADDILNMFGIPTETESGYEPTPRYISPANEADRAGRSRRRRARRAARRASRR